MNITKIVKQIEDNNLDQNFWLIKLGFSLNNEMNIQTSYENDLIYNFYEIGKKYWENNYLKIKELLCNMEEKIPKEYVTEIISGDIRSFIEALILFLASKFEISISIAIPLVSLIIKKGINNFCL